MQKTPATTISEYNTLQPKQLEDICTLLAFTITKQLKQAQEKIWHGSPVWFIDGNPIVAYSSRKNNTVCLMFFSGQSFDEPLLLPQGKFKAAEIYYKEVKDVKITHLTRWLKKAATMQWDYKNIIKNKGVLNKIEPTPAQEQQPSRKRASGLNHDERIRTMSFAMIYPLYLKKVEKKGRTKKELDQTIEWLTGYNEKELQKLLQKQISFEDFFNGATLHKNAHLITGVICGYRVEEIKNPLTQKVRYLDKLVDELAQRRPLEKLFRTT